MGFGKERKTVLLAFLLALNVMAQEHRPYEAHAFKTTIEVGAENVAAYLPLLEGKSVGVIANQTSMLNDVHLVDTLLALNVNVKRVFSPEHGFRGKADAGEKVKSGIDAKTGLPVASLYGKNKKPKPEVLEDLDVLVFDLQDVGVRFYTYISTMHYIMEAAAENGVEVIVLDRPNPNGFYVDGPVLELKHKSFVGMHPVPIVHGMTVGEYAQMINGEGWLAEGKTCSLTVIPCKDYGHNDFYRLPIKPSPNLPNMEAVYLYPSLCLFEGTVVSIGRGTDSPFQVVGHPDLSKKRFSFTPTSREGAKKPKHQDQLCYGYDLTTFGQVYMRNVKELYLFWVIGMYEDLEDKEDFFLPNKFFNLLAGNSTLMQQIKDEVSVEQIRASWEPKLSQFKTMRKKYLLYPDFE